MASVLDSVKHYQHSIEKYANDEQKVLKCIDKLYNLDVTVQHLQETGVGRTVNALRKEPGGVGQAARALVYKWKTMVAAEESDQEEHKTDTSNYNGHENEKYCENDSSESRSKYEKPEKSYKAPKNEEKQHINANGDYGSKRKYQSSEEEEPEVKKSRYPSTKDNNYKVKTEVKVKQEPSESEMDSQDDSSQSDSESDSQSSEEDRKPDIKVLKETISKTESQSLKKHSSSSSRDKHKHDSYSDNSKNNSEKHHRSHTSDGKYSSDKSSSKEKSHSAHSHKGSKEHEKSNIKKEKEHRRHESEKKHRSESSSKHSDKHRSSQSSEKQKNSNSSTDKHRSSSNCDKQKSSDEKHRSSSNSDKHTSSSISEKQKPSSAEKHKHHAEKHTSSKTDREKQKHSSEKEISSDRHKTKENNNSSSSSSKDKLTSSSKEKSKDKSSSSKTKEDSHKSVKSHSSSKSNDDKRKSESSHHEKSSKKSKHKSNSSKSGSSRSKHEERKKNDGENVDDGIDCGSGASFAEALGMISPTKPKKKSVVKDISSPNVNDDMSPATLLSPTAKLAPLPALEISALPEISPNYRPRPPPKFLPHFTDDEAMNAGLSSKNQRTKVYSGNKVIGKIPTLYEMCVHILQEHIDSLEYTGGVPYDILKPVVDRATPQQLFVLEHYNPYLMEDTDHLWQKFCEKNFRNKKRQELETWREMYMRCQEEQEIKLKSLTKNIKIAQEAKKAPIKQTKMAYVDCVVKPPRNIAKKQAQHGTAFATAASPAARVASLAATPNVLKGGRPTPVPTVSTSSLKPKKAPLMQKALQFLRGRKR